MSWAHLARLTRTFRTGQYRCCGSHHSSGIVGRRSGGTTLLRRFTPSCSFLTFSYFSLRHFGRACGEHVTVNVTGARGGGRLPPPSLPSFTLGRLCSPPPLLLPPFPLPDYFRHASILATRCQDRAGNGRIARPGGARGRRPVVAATRHIQREGIRPPRVARATVLVRPEELAQPTHPEGGRWTNLVTAAQGRG